MVSRKFVIPLLALAAFGQAAVARADGRPSVTEDLRGKDIVSQPIPIEIRWQFGLLRLELNLADGSSAASPWEIVLHGDRGETIAVNSKNAASRVIGTTDSTRLRLDIPVPAWSALQVSTKAPVKSVSAIEAQYASLARAQQRLNDSTVDYFDQGVGAQERALALAFGRLDVLGVDKNPTSRICTAFRVKTGFWLTAAHCVTRDPKGASDAESASVQPVNYAGKVEPTGRLETRVLATGQRTGEWNAGKELQNDEIDFALLAVPNDPGGLAFSIATQAAREKANVQLLMHWSGSPVGKARSAGPGCVIQSLLGTNIKTNADLCYRAIRHGCTSDDGASGAALVLRDSPQLLAGMNYRGGLSGEFNCALPVASIQKFLCQTKPQLANELAPCPGQ